MLYLYLKKMENRGLLFIPDISGFTRFVNETEIEHSRLIIQELLEILINANQMGLEISEIEGDAILFYKFGEPPALETIYQQVSQMFCAFHSNLVAYEHRRYCQCTACTSAIGLTLKVITHYGEFTGYNVKNFSKLIGKDIIIAHQLLKNDIAQHEYWLVTDGLIPGHAPDRFEQWMKWEDSEKRTDSGVIPFRYTQLTALKNDLPPEHYPKLQLEQKVKVLSLTRDYTADILKLFHATGDLNYRGQWQEEVIKVEEAGHFLPRVGMRCRCIYQDHEVMVRASSYHYQENRIEFSEEEEQTQNVTYYILEKTGPQSSRLTLEYYLPRKPFQQIRFNLLKKSHLKEKLNRSMINLDALVKEIY